MRKRSPKNLRVSQEVARELSVIIRGLKDPRIGLMTSVMDAEVAPDLKTFQAFVNELTGAPHVRNVKTSLTLRVSKDAPMVPMDQVQIVET